MNRKSYSTRDCPCREKKKEKEKKKNLSWRSSPPFGRCCLKSKFLVKLLQDSFPAELKNFTYLYSPRISVQHSGKHRESIYFQDQPEQSSPVNPGGQIHLYCLVEIS